MRWISGILALSLLANAAAAQEVKSLWTRTKGYDWPGFLGAQRDSQSAETGLIKSWPMDGPPIVWSMPIGEGYAAPTVVKGRLLHFHRLKDHATLSCVHAETGKELWSFSYKTDYTDMYGYDGGPRAQPLVDENRIYLYGVEGLLHCLNLADGAVIWKLDTVKTFGVVQNFFGVGSVPIIEGDKLIVMVGGSPPDSLPIHTGRVTGNGTGVVAFDKRTGKVLYKLSDELASYSSLQLATINSKRYAFALARGGLLAFDPNTGKQHFHYPWRDRKLESVNASTPVVWDDKVFITECYGPGSTLLQITPGKAPGYQIVWKDNGPRNVAMGAHWNTPIKIGAYLYASSGRNKGDAELRCIEAETGKVMWFKPDLSRASLLYADGLFICQLEIGKLLLIKPNPEKFDYISVSDIKGKDGRFLIQEPAWAAPVLSHGYLYVRGAGKLVCLDLRPRDAAK